MNAGAPVCVSFDDPGRDPDGGALASLLYRALEAEGWAPVLLHLGGEARGGVREDEWEGMRTLHASWPGSARRLAGPLRRFAWGVAAGRWSVAAAPLAVAGLPYGLWMGTALEVDGGARPASLWARWAGALLRRRALGAERALVEGAAHVWCTSEASLRALGARFPAAAGRLSRLRPRRAVEGEDIPDEEKEERVVLFRGDPAAPASNFALLLRAFRTIKAAAATEDVRLLVLGPRPRGLSLTLALRGMGLEDAVAFTGVPGRAAEERAFREGWLYVLSADHEPSGVGVLAAMSHGVPVVATASGAAEEFVIDGENGLLVPPGDERALNRAMAQLLFHDGLRAACRSGGYRTLREAFDEEGFRLGLRRGLAALAG